MDPLGDTHEFGSLAALRAADSDTDYSGIESDGALSDSDELDDDEFLAEQLKSQKLRDWWPTSNVGTASEQEKMAPPRQPANSELEQGDSVLQTSHDGPGEAKQAGEPVGEESEHQADQAFDRENAAWVRDQREATTEEAERSDVALSCAACFTTASLCARYANPRMRGAAKKTSVAPTFLTRQLFSCQVVGQRVRCNVCDADLGQPLPDVSAFELVAVLPSFAEKRT